MFCVGAAVFDRNGQRVAAISGTGLKLSRPTWRMDELGLTLREAADQITVALGGPPFAERQLTVAPFASRPPAWWSDRG